MVPPAGTRLLSKLCLFFNRQGVEYGTRQLDLEIPFRPDKVAWLCRETINNAHAGFIPGSFPRLSVPTPDCGSLQPLLALPQGLVISPSWSFNAADHAKAAVNPPPFADINEQLCSMSTPQEGEHLPR